MDATESCWGDDHGAMARFGGFRETESDISVQRIRGKEVADNSTTQLRRGRIV